MPQQKADLGGCLLLVASIAPLTMWRGYVISVLWRWFVTTLGVAALGWANACGFALLFSVFVAHPRTEEEKKKDVVDTVLDAFAVPLIALGLGWVIRQFM